MDDLTKLQSALSRGGAAEWHEEMHRSEIPALLLDPDSARIVDANAAACRLYGFPFDDLLDLDPTALSPPRQPQGGESARLVSKLIETAKAGEMSVFKWLHHDRNGEDIPCEVQLVGVRLGNSLLIHAQVFPELRGDSTRELRFNLVTEMVQELALAGSLDDGLQALVKLVCEEGGWAYGETWMPDTDGKRLVLRQQYCREDGAVSELAASSRDMTFGLNEGLPGRVWNHGAPEWIPDLDKTRPRVFLRLQAALSAGLHSAFSLPLMKDGEVVAVAVFFMRTYGSRDRILMESLTSLAPQLAILLLRRRLEQDLLQREELLESIFNNVPCMVFRRVMHADGRLEYPYVGGSLLKRLGIAISEHQPVGDWAKRLMHPEDLPVFERELQRSMERGEPMVIDVRMSTPEGEQRWIRSVSTPRTAEPIDDTMTWDAFAIDITEERLLREQAESVPNRDRVTQLLTRQAFEEQLVGLAAMAERHQEKMLVLALNIDRFRLVNDTYGMTAGDALLFAVAERLRGSLPEDCLLARIGNDEYAIAATGLRNDHDITRWLKSLRKDMSRSFRILDKDLVLGFTAGFTVLPDDSDKPQDVLHDALLAMHRARREDKGYTARFSRGRDEGTMSVITTEQELRFAISHNQLEVHLQPQVSPDFRRLLGFEALIRWRHPTRGMVSPGTFIPVAEESGLIEEIFRFVLDDVTRMQAGWLQKGLEAVPISVNVSPTQMHLSNTLFDDVNEALALANLDASLVKLEITEGTLLKNFELGTELLQKLERRGVRVVLDDFGVGYSSLNYLAHLPVSSIKVDRSFVRNLDESAASRTILRAILGLAESLEKPAMVEGVETQSQRQHVRRWRCEGIQGYLFSKPLPEADAEQMIVNMTRGAGGPAAGQAK